MPPSRGSSWAKPGLRMTPDGFPNALLVALEAALELEIGDAPVELELLPFGRVYVVVDHVVAHSRAQELGPVEQRRRFPHGLGDLAELLRRIVSVAREGGL